MFLLVNINPVDGGCAGEDVGEGGADPSTYPRVFYFVDLTRRAVAQALVLALRVVEVEPGADAPGVSEFRAEVGHDRSKEPDNATTQRTPRIPDAVLDQLLAGADAQTAFDPNGLIDDLKKALAERVLNAEMDHHLAGEEPGNRRNGYGKKTVITDTGQIELEVPRDRQARFDPQPFARSLRYRGLPI